MPLTERAERPTQAVPIALVRFCHWLCFALFVLAVVLVSVDLVRPTVLPQALATDAGEVLLMFAIATTLFSLCRQLPAQNVLLAAVIIGLISGVVAFVGLKTAVPFGPFLFSQDVQPQFQGLPLFVPLVWIVTVLNSRGVARLILRPWRKTRTYGWWAIGLTVVLCVAMDLGWEVFAGPEKRYVYWAPTKFPVSWHGVPISNFMGWIVTLLLILAICTPALINKRHTRSTPDYQPLLVWLLLNMVFLIGAAENQLWSAVAATAACCVVASIFAVRGARW